MEVSVIICAHNPRPDYLQRVLASLRAQTLGTDRWELLLVDNHSEKPLAEYHDLGWHPQGRHLREDELGLAAARRCGIEASTADLLIFVDDDNILQEDYLAESLRLFGERPYIGTFGGQLLPEYETEPVVDTVYYESFLALRTFDKPRWSNDPEDFASSPIGAGLCVHRTIALHHLGLLREDARRLKLGRTGGQLLSGEDTDLVHTACELGYGKGVFPELKLIHLIPAKRMQPDFLLRIYEGNCYSTVLSRCLRGEKRLRVFAGESAAGRLLRTLSHLRKPALARQLDKAGRRGQERALQDLAKWGWIDDPAHP